MKFVWIAIFALTCLTFFSRAYSAIEIENSESPNTYQVMTELLDTLIQRQEKLSALKTRANNLSGDADRYLVDDAASVEELAELINSLDSEIKDINAQVHAVATGVNENNYVIDNNEPIDIKTEIEQLFKPLVAMLKAATETSRQIESLKNNLAEINRQQNLASNALQSLEIVQKQPSSPNAIVHQQIAGYQTIWQERLQIANDRASALQQQLKAKLESREKPGLATGKAFAKFIKARFVSLALGLLSFLVVFGLFRLLGYLARKIINVFRSTKPDTVMIRGGSLLYKILSVLSGMIAMLAVFNIRSDWLLLGFGTILLLGMLWTLVKMLPQLFEQLTMMLNLGAVQEHERLMFLGVPWKVEKLSFYTTLINPMLRGGDLALPIRELLGLYSRPIAVEEPWFPSQEGDWVLLDDNKIAQVIIQTPETVQLKKLGGALLTIPSATYVEQPPVNLSHGYRVELEFGIDYKHQKNATTTILAKMRSQLEQELPKMLPNNCVRNIEVEFFSAGESALIYEIEIDIKGSAANEYEEIQRLVSKILLETANDENWTIPLQQLVIHQN